MNAHATANNRIELPHVKDMVQSISESASAFANFDSLSAAPKQRSAPRLVHVSAPTPLWMPPQSITPASRFRKAAALALVVLVHILGAYALTHLPPQAQDIVAQPLQVALLAAPQSEREQPLPPPVVQQPSITLPDEPVLLTIAEPSVTAITVETRPEPAASDTSAVGTPKVVSSVEYIREPATKYPPAARALKQRGTVMLRALIDASGHAREVNVHRSSGHRLLDDAARTAVLNALFKPYTENGQSVPVYVFIPIEFGAA
jgi:protein TonB